MMRWTPYIFLRLVFFLILGIIFQDFTHFKALGVFIIFFLGGILYVFLAYLLPARLRVRFNPLIGLLACTLIFLFGWIRAGQHDKSLEKTNLLYQPGIEAYTIALNSEAQPKAKSIRFEGLIQQAKIEGKWKNVSGKIILYFRKDSLKTANLEYRDVLYIQGTPNLVEPPKNPAAFDYRSYLRYQNIFHQHFVDQHSFYRISELKHFDIFLISYRIRAYLTGHLRRYVAHPQSLGIASALLLGVNAHLDSELRSAYAGSGLMHILSVSGLHIAFVVFLLNGLFGKLKNQKRGAWIYLIVVITSLWMYAFLTGLSPSVLRAAAMFSFVLVGQALRKRSPIYNTIGASAFILIAWNPYLVFSVSFQLSYVAVLGIVYLQPRFYRLLVFKHWFWDYLWSMTCVSMAAQIVTFPLGLYYFNQFPNYFLISNLLVLPFVQIVFYVGIALLFTPLFHFISQWLGWALNGMIQLTNLVTIELYELPYSVTEGIQIGVVELYLLYGCILGLMLLFESRKFSYLVGAAVCLVIFSVFQIQRVYFQKHQEYLVIYDTPKSSNLNLIYHQKSVILADSTLIADQKLIDYNINPFLDSVGVSHRDFRLMDRANYAYDFFSYKNEGEYGLLLWKNYRILILQKKISFKNLQKLRKIKPDYILIRQKAIRKMEVLAETLPAKNYIIDASNGYFLSRKLSQEADSLDIQCHVIAQKGAFMLRP
ncbi:MAG: ComEC/Rec2 family competence protein [Microscillaceae bacterium]|nr:ComEC/Rec2 family competence protein [Microscillaceae bacterium]